MNTHDERRSLYRVPARHTDALEIRIEPARQSRVAPDSLDINAAGLGATFGSRSAPDLAVGDRARIHISGAGIPGALEVGSTVTAVAERSGQRHLGFRFDPGGLSPEGIPQACYRLFNRRMTYRAPLHERTLAEAHPWPAGEPRLDLAIRDVSLSGISCLLEAVDRDPLEGRGELTLSFRLPDRPRLFRYGATIRCREPGEAGIRYALAFDHTHTPMYLEQAEELADFVMERYLEEFQGTEH